MNEELKMMCTNLFHHEWLALQGSFESYERWALLLKLSGVALMGLALACGVGPLWSAAGVALLWLQEGMLRTAQQRVCQRLLRVETALRSPDGAAGSAFQLHTEFEAGRPGTLGLVQQYLRNACRPTVAYPYVVLVLASMCLGR